jgi:hypothetical protein
MDILVFQSMDCFPDGTLENKDRSYTVNVSTITPAVYAEIAAGFWFAAFQAQRRHYSPELPVTFGANKPAGFTTSQTQGWVNQFD